MLKQCPRTVSHQPRLLALQHYNLYPIARHDPDLIRGFRHPILNLLTERTHLYAEPRYPHLSMVVKLHIDSQYSKLFAQVSREVMFLEGRDSV